MNTFTKYRFLGFFCLLSIFFFCQNKKTDDDNVSRKQLNEILKFRKNLDKEYLNEKETPLRGDNFKKFKGHPFFPIDLKYRITARFEKNNNPIPFALPTSSGQLKMYQEYGKATFLFEGQSYTLSVYQSLDLMQIEEYQNHLFLPFRDLTNEKQTYGGGKYLDLKIPKGDSLTIDFNKSYHPYCAYNAFDYSCPIVPQENKLPIEIRAGVMYDDIYHH